MKRAIIGAGGQSDEIAAYLDPYNYKKFPRFVDHEYWQPNDNNVFSLNDFNPDEWEVIIGIANPEVKERIANSLPKETSFFTYISPSAFRTTWDTTIGEGSLICPLVTLTCDIHLGKHTHLNIHTTVGHNARLGDFFTSGPGANISGNVKTGKCVYVGSNASIKEKVTICDNVTIGMNTTVVKDITEPGVYVGTPARKIS